MQPLAASQKFPSGLEMPCPMRKLLEQRVVSSQLTPGVSAETVGHIACSGACTSAAACACTKHSVGKSQERLQAEHNLDVQRGYTRPLQTWVEHRGLAHLRYAVHWAKGTCTCADFKFHRVP